MHHLSDTVIDSIVALNAYMGDRALGLHLLGAMESAGRADRDVLARAFPDLHTAWRVWSSFEDSYPTAKEMTTALELASRTKVYGL